MVVGEHEKIRLIIMEPITFISESLHGYVMEYFPDVTVIAVTKSLREMELIAMEHSCNLVITELYSENESILDWCQSMLIITASRPECRLALWTNNNKCMIEYLNVIPHPTTIISKRLSLLDLHKKLSAIFNRDESECQYMMDTCISAGDKNRLTPQELSVIFRLIQGQNTHYISARMALNIKTISCHKRNAMRKMGVSSNAELFHLAKNAKNYADLFLLLQKVK